MNKVFRLLKKLSTLIFIPALLIFFLYILYGKILFKDNLIIIFANFHRDVLEMALDLKIYLELSL